MKDVVLDTETTGLSVKDGHRKVEIKMTSKKLKKTMAMKLIFCLLRQELLQLIKIK